jgi:hypothetical protein
LSDDDDGRPPDLRFKLLKLADLLRAVEYRAARELVPELFELATDLEDEVDDLVEALGRVQERAEQRVSGPPLAG